MMTIFDFEEGTYSVIFQFYFGNPTSCLRRQGRIWQSHTAMILRPLPSFARWAQNYPKAMSKGEDRLVRLMPHAECVELEIRDL